MAFVCLSFGYLALGARPVNEARARSHQQAEPSLIGEATVSRWATPAISRERRGSTKLDGLVTVAQSPLAVESPLSPPLTLAAVHSDSPQQVPSTPPSALEPSPETATLRAMTPADEKTGTTSDKPTAPADVAPSPPLKPARELFGAMKTPAPLSARAIGTYARGCLSGGTALPVDGPAWQVMRLSRNRNWGHPKLISLIEKLAADGRAKDDWPGLLVGDIAQPRGGPMLSGHASHQIGLDADIWLTPMPDRTLDAKERETIEATSMLGEDGLTVNRSVWTDSHLKILRRAASYADVERIFVHPAIKQVLCSTATGDRGWLTKVRPYWGHYYHFHVRMTCPQGSSECTPQKAVPGDDGCGKEVEDWLKHLANIKPEPAPLPLPGAVTIAKPAPPEHPTTLDQLPSQCSTVLATGHPEMAEEIAAASRAVTKKAQATVAAARKTAALAKPTSLAKPTAPTKSKEPSRATKVETAAPASPSP